MMLKKKNEKGLKFLKMVIFLDLQVLLCEEDSFQQFENEAFFGKMRYFEYSRTFNSDFFFGSGINECILWKQK